MVFWVFLFQLLSLFKFVGLFCFGFVFFKGGEGLIYKKRMLAWFSS